ncbi:TatD family hydrolase, partial [Francisella tularensis]|uniref:TatD family hydrolase n=1 Tax=Francisella tularensis TaxID=263 RepID=UPI002381CC8C
AANQVNKPVVVHIRAAKQDTLEILKSENVEKCGGILHCFTEDYDLAKKALDMGMYITFSGILTFKNAKDIQETAKKLPL